jgi:N-methylhydantoinase A
VRVISVDTGGTFTDVLLFDEASRTVLARKHPSTPRDPSEAFLQGVDQFVAEGFAASSLDRVVHGTTVATNTVLTRTGARAGVITTAGFRDVLEIGRGARPFQDMFNQRWQKPKPLVERYLRLGVRERTDARGRVLVELDEAELRDAVAFLVGHDIQSLAICFLFSYLNPANERRAKAVVEASFPGLPVSISSEILPQWREYERTNTTVVDAYVKPVMSDYLGRLETGLGDRGYGGDVLIMKSNGGATKASNAAAQPVETFLSGPAAAIVASRHIAHKAGFERLVSIDVGGTSFDMAVLDESGERLTTDGEIAPTLPVKVAMVEVMTIGAGGGSIAWRDVAGGLNVGPMSAGADPGPVCFGRGGEKPTVTDANLVLGRIDPAYFLGGSYPLRADLADAAIERLAAEFGLTGEALAQGVLDVTASAMAQEIRAAASRTGADLRDYVLFAGGGAGPLHAPAIAREVGIGKVIAPYLPGMLSTIGLLLTDLRFDTFKSYPTIVEKADIPAIAAALGDMATDGLARVHKEGLSAEISVKHFVEMRYRRQHSEVGIPVDPDSLTAAGLAAAFDAEHHRLFGYSMPDHQHEIINLRCTVAGVLSDPSRLLDRVVPQFPDEDAQPVGKSYLYDEALRTRVNADVYLRTDLAKGQVLVGPTIVMAADSTVYVPGDGRAIVDSQGNIVIELGVVPAM